MRLISIVVLACGALFAQQSISLASPAEDLKNMEIRVLKLQLQEAALVQQFDRDPTVISTRAALSAAQRDLDVAKKKADLEAARKQAQSQSSPTRPIE